MNAFVANDTALQRDQFLRVNNTRPLPRGLITELIPEVAAPLPRNLAAKRLPSALCDLLNRLGAPFDTRAQLEGDHSLTIHPA